MESWRRELYVNELYHHGIRGQQWGVRNGPPYPLTAEAKRQNYRKQGRRFVAGGIMAGAAGAGLKAIVKPIRQLNRYNRARNFVSQYAPYPAVYRAIGGNVPLYVNKLLETPLGKVLTSPVVSSFVKSPAVSIIQGSLFALSAGLNAYGAYKYIRSGIEEGTSNPKADSTKQILKDVLKAVAIGATPVLVEGVLSMTPVSALIQSKNLGNAVFYGTKAVEMLSKVGVMQTSMEFVKDASAQVTRIVNDNKDRITETINGIVERRALPPRRSSPETVST